MQKFIFTPDKHIGWERDGKSTRPLHDAAAIKALMAFAKDFKPDLWIEGGDNLDCGPVSHWLKDRHLSAKDLNLKRDLAEAIDLDEAVLQVLRTGRWGDLANLDPVLIERAWPDAGLRHLEVLRGFLLGDRSGRVIEYERSPGIGTVLAEFALELETDHED